MLSCVELCSCCAVLCCVVLCCIVLWYVCCVVLLCCCCVVLHCVVVLCSFVLYALYKVPELLCVRVPDESDRPGRYP